MNNEIKYYMAKFLIDIDGKKNLTKQFGTCTNRCEDHQEQNRWLRNKYIVIATQSLAKVSKIYMEGGDSLFDKWCSENMSKGESRTQDSFQMDQSSHTLKLQEGKKGKHFRMYQR